MKQMETGLKNRVVIVAGASQGIGRATARAFAAEGATLAIFARNVKTLKAAADEIRAEYKSSDVYAEPLDATDFPNIDSFVKRTAEHFGRIDVIVANAGGPPAKNFLSTTLDDWRKAVDANFLSVVALAKAAIPYMQKNRWGRVVTITSTSVKHPIPDLVLSNAVRPSVMALVRSLSVEFGADNITFNNVGPGYTTTERLNELAGTRALAAGVNQQEIYKQWAAQIPLRRLAKPEEIAEAIVWLASERASYITGQTILVDGGHYRGF
jgi:3-oxoacyl-[acyl-carrier protein] reductase